MPVTKLSKKYQITIPRSVREVLGLEQGVRLNIRAKGGRKIVLEPLRKSLVSKYKGLSKDVWRKLGGTDEYLNKERTIWERAK